jgi:rsbT co-antagonist protein RsbR
MANVLRETELAQLVDHLRAEVDRRDQLLAAVEEMSTPVVHVWDGILAMPLVGAIDAARATRIMENLLSGIVHTQAELVILDITGIPVVDTAVAHHLLKTMKAASLLGAQCVLVGMSSETATSIVHPGVVWSGVVTRSNLQAGIEYALGQLGLVVVSRSAAEAGN